VYGLRGVLGWIAANSSNGIKAAISYNFQVCETTFIARNRIGSSHAKRVSPNIGRSGCLPRP
jgi:hypothetical protein